MIEDIYKILQPKVVLDCGAHRGEDSLKFASDPDCRVFSFEICDAVYADLRANVANVPNIETYQLAVSNENGKVCTIYESMDANKASSSLQKPKVHHQWFPHIKFASGNKVRTITIDTFCILKGLKEIDVLWLDLQGHELYALQGATQTLENTRVIHMEFYKYEIYENQPRFQEIQDVLGPNWEMIHDGGNCNIVWKNRKLAGREKRPVAS